MASNELLRFDVTDMGANALNIDFIGGTLGDGSFGDVFRGTLRGAPIAFKRFKMFRQRDYLEPRRVTPRRALLNGTWVSSSPTFSTIILRNKRARVRKRRRTTLSMSIILKSFFSNWSIRSLCWRSQSVSSLL